MANRERGEVAAIVADENLTLKFTANSICELETTLDRGIIDIADEMRSWGPPTGPGDDGQNAPETPQQQADRLRRIRFKTARALFWASLRSHHPHITIEAAGDLIMRDQQGLGAVLLPVATAFAAAFGSPAEESTTRPPMPAAAGDGTGANS